MMLHIQMLKYSCLRSLIQESSIRAEPRRVTFMNATSISFGLLIVLFTILLFHRMRKLKPQVAGFRSQRMCPSCGLITSRLNPRCLECGVASVSKR